MGRASAAFFAAMHPDRVLALVLYNSWAGPRGRATIRSALRRTTWSDGGGRSKTLGNRRDGGGSSRTSPRRTRTTRNGSGGRPGIAAPRSVARCGARVRRVRAGDRRSERARDGAGADPRALALRGGACEVGRSRRAHPGCAARSRSPARIGCHTRATSTRSSARSSAS